VSIVSDTCTCTCMALLTALLIAKCSEYPASGENQFPSLSFRGVISTELFSPKEAKAFFSSKAEFLATATNESWEIELRYLAPAEVCGTGESCKRIPDGVRIRPTFERRSSTALLAATALPLPYPPPEKTPFLLCWLCLCPAPELPTLDNVRIRRFVSVPVQANPKNEGFFEAKYLMPVGRFLSSLSVTNNGISFSTDGKTYPYAPPFGAGFLEFQYELLATTNVGGLIVPLRAAVKRFSPLPGAVTVKDVYTRVLSSLTVTSVSASPLTPLSEWPSEYMALDQRPAQLPLGVTVNYSVSEDEWQPVTSEKIQRLAEITRIANRPKVAATRSTAVFVELTLLVVGTAVLFWAYRTSIGRRAARKQGLS
jgi:hypothetical protein